MEYQIKGLNGFTPQIGHLVSQMNYARETTLQAVRDLKTSELDFIPSKEGNSIGALLLHIAAVEKGFQIEIFDDRKPNEQEMADWGGHIVLENKVEKILTDIL